MPASLTGFIVTARPLSIPLEELQVESVVAWPVLAEDHAQALAAIQEKHADTHAVVGVLGWAQLQQWTGMLEQLAQSNGIKLPV